MPNNHLCLRDGDLYTCCHCPWRAVQTTRGIVVTVHGAPDADHHAGIALAAQQRRDWIERIVTRLRTQYIGGAQLPEPSRALYGPFDDYTTPQRLTLRQLQRLMRCVMTEYGDT